MFLSAKLGGVRKFGCVHSEILNGGRQGNKNSGVGFDDAVSWDMNFLSVCHIASLQFLSRKELVVNCYEIGFIIKILNII